MEAAKTCAPAVTRRKGIGHSTNIFPAVTRRKGIGYLTNIFPAVTRRKGIEFNIFSAGTARAEGPAVNELCECKFSQFLCDEASEAIQEQRFSSDEETEAVPAKRVSSKGIQQVLVHALFLSDTVIFIILLFVYSLKRLAQKCAAAFFIHPRLDKPTIPF